MSRIVGAGMRGPAAATPGAGVPLAAVLAMLRAAVTSGADVASALGAVGAALDDLDARGEDLALAARRLRLGLPWDEAWEGTDPRWSAVRRALADSWSRGASPVGALDAAREALALSTRLAGERAAAALGVRLAIPLTLCLLPAFVLVAVVPLFVSLASALVEVW